MTNKPKQTLPAGWNLEVEQNDTNAFLRLTGPDDSVVLSAERNSVRALFFAEFAAAVAAAVQPQEDTMGVIGPDGVKHHLFRTRAEENAAVARSPLKVAADLMALADGVGAVMHGVPTPDPRTRLAPLLNAYGELQWRSGSGRDVPHDQITAAFDAVIDAAAGLQLKEKDNG